jgi:rhomboid family GlyGly-CTERM serine protease
MRYNTINLLKIYWPAPVLICLVFLLQQGNSTEWYWQRSLLSSEPWRLLSGHYVHIDSVHLAGNILVFLVACGLWAKSFSLIDWLFTLILLPLLISTLLTTLSLQWYCGLSGILHGLFVLGIWRNWQRNPLAYTLMAVILAAKLIAEQTGVIDLIYKPYDWAVIDRAHLFGSLATLGVLGLSWLIERARKNRVR